MCPSDEYEPLIPSVVPGSTSERPVCGSMLYLPSPPDLDGEAKSDSEMLLSALMRYVSFPIAWICCWSAVYAWYEPGADSVEATPPVLASRTGAPPAS
jgi:hypothetical protein